MADKHIVPYDLDLNQPPLVDKPIATTPINSSQSYLAQSGHRPIEEPQEDQQQSPHPDILKERKAPAESKTKRKELFWSIHKLKKRFKKTTAELEERIDKLCDIIYDLEYRLDEEHIQRKSLQYNVDVLNHHVTKLELKPIVDKAQKFGP